MYMWVYLHTHICGLLFNVIGRCQLHQLSKYKRVHLVINGPFYVSLIANYYSELLICGVINEILTLCHRLRWNSRNGYTIDSLKNIALCIFDIIKITLFFVGFFFGFGIASVSWKRIYHFNVHKKLCTNTIYSIFSALNGLK